MNTSRHIPKAVVVILHGLCWMLLFYLPYLMRPSFEAPHKLLEENRSGFIVLNVITRMVWVVLFYFNANVLVPKLIFTRKFLTYVGCFLLTVAVLLLMDRTLFMSLTTNLHYNFQNFFFFNFFPILFIIASSVAYKVIMDRMKNESLQKEKETENLKTELSLLRSQVSPHFMFNVLNNMVALARKKSDQLEPSLIKLSSLLRYMLYETTTKVPLQKEIEYLQSYIDLQKQRFGSNIKINNCMEKVDSNYDIEPMLLIPFVENAFKHGTGMIENAEIDIQLKAENGLLSFSVRNRFDPQSAEIKDEASGIGLANVWKRLQLLYNDKQSLLINKNEGWFMISLQIVLQ